MRGDIEEGDRKYIEAVRGKGGASAKAQPVRFPRVGNNILLFIFYVSAVIGTLALGRQFPKPLSTPPPQHFPSVVYFTLSDDDNVASWYNYNVGRRCRLGGHLKVVSSVQVNFLIQ